jgi:competence protein ComGC
MIYQNMPNGTDFSNYKHLYQGLNFANLGEGYNYHTQNDKFSNLSDTYLTQQATFIHDVIKETSNMNLNDLYQTNENAIFFSYLNLGTVFYSYTFGYILTIFAIILIISIVIIKIMKHNNTLIKTLKGYVVFLSAIFGSAIFAFILYYLFSYTAVLFNVIDIHSVGAVNFSSVPLVLCVIFISIILCAIITNYLIKLFKITGNDVRRSVSYVIGSMAIALSFDLQVTSYLFIYASIFLLMIELLSITIKKIDTDKLHLNLVVIGLISPIYLPMVFLSSDALGIDMSYAIAALSAIYAMLFIPNYLDSFKFFSISQIKNLIKKENKQIKPISGMISLLVLGVLILFIITSTKTNLSVNNLGKQNATMLPYDDALVYVIDEDNAHYLFKDLDAYPYLKNKLDGYTYNEQVSGYEKEDLNPLVSLTGLSNFNFSGNKDMKKKRP